LDSAAYSVKAAKTNAPINMTAAITMSVRKNLAIEANAGLAVPSRRGLTSADAIRPSTSLLSDLCTGTCVFLCRRLAAPGSNIPRIGGRLAVWLVPCDIFNRPVPDTERADILRPWNAVERLQKGNGPKVRAGPGKRQFSPRSSPTRDSAMPRFDPAVWLGPTCVVRQSSRVGPLPRVTMRGEAFR
jgi:hypothetical protein